MTTSRTPLIPVIKTDMCRTRRGRECWGAETADHAWAFIRLELPGTPWAVRHIATGLVVDGWRSSLTDCRWFVTAGHADAELDAILARILAHEGAHGGAALPRCAGCQDWLALAAGMRPAIPVTMAA